MMATRELQTISNGALSPGSMRSSRCAGPAARRRVCGGDALRQRAMSVALGTLLIGVLWASSARPADAGSDTWTTNGPEGGVIQALAINPATPTTLYAGTGSGGVFKSANGGAQWSAMNTGLSSPIVTAIVINPGTPATLYAGTSGGVFRSTDGGAHWSAVNTGLTDSSIKALVIDPV